LFKVAACGLTRRCSRPLKSAAAERQAVLRPRDEMKSIYDEHVPFYLDFVDRGLAHEEGLLQVLIAAFDDLLGDRVLNARICDVGCGEGYLGRHFVQRGARQVVGIDLSAGLIEAAKRRSEAPNLQYRVDDAHELRTLADASFDVVVSQLALMDIADHQRMFRAVRRVLTETGAFVFSLLHPCFEGSPFRLPDEPKLVVDESGVPNAYAVRRYATEGFWQSGGDGVRGRMGSYHRMVSTYVNDLLDSGFRVERVREPVVVGAGLFSEVPQTMLVAAQVDASDG
jgi:ubiquinone/menaquinone biosynthesis C-methylase UbiE